MQTEFTKNGFHHRQVVRVGNVAIFDRVKRGNPHFEVVVIVAHGPYEIAGIKFPAGESYPSSEQWGSKGWTYREYEDAQKRLISLT